jgi:glycosyltransferase involved in cell wall biosynthesis
MKVLLCHTYYTQRGGEDRSFEEERELLAAHGHCVIEYVRKNDELTRMNGLRAAATTLWNRRAARKVTALIRHEQPDVVHFTNTFPLISPAVCHAAHGAGVAVVQALRNYRLVCAGAYLMRDGRPCEDCLGRTVPWPAVVHRCYRGSAAASSAVAAMQLLHRALGTWQNKIDAFFTLTEFARQKFIDAGFPAGRVHVKYNCVHPDPGVGRGDGNYAVMAGRLSPEKGVATLLDAWRRHADLPPLKILGDGPLGAAVRTAAASDPRIEWLGQQDVAEVQRTIGAAAVLLMPSVWYETFGRTIAEAYAGATPVIASRLGALVELVDEGVTGWLFEPANADDLAAKVRAAMAMSAERRLAFRQSARATYERQFTPAQNYDRLMEIYDVARRSAALRTAPRRSSRPVQPAPAPTP